MDRDENSELNTEATTPAPPDATETVAALNRRRRWILAAVLAPVLLLLAVFGADRWIHSGQVLRGVHVDDVALAGLDRDQARLALEQLAQRLRAQPITVTVRGRHYELEPASLGYELDVEQTLGAAMNAGRTGGFGAELRWWLARTQSDAAIPARGTLDREALTDKISRWQDEAINDPPFEGAITIENGEPTARPPAPGYVVDLDATSQALAVALSSLQRRPIALSLRREPPVRKQSAVDAALSKASKLLAGPITLSATRPKTPTLDHEDKAPKKKRNAKSEDDEPVDETLSFTFTRAELGDVLRSRLTDKALGVDVYFDPEALAAYLGSARAALEVAPIDARFDVNKKKEVRIVPSRHGRLVRAGDVAKALEQAAMTTARSGELPVEIGAPPKFSTADAEGLQIKERVSHFTTVHPCCRPRVTNIHKIADLLDGTILRRGESLSVNQTVGRRTRAKGFLPAPTIVNGEMKDTVGGGISQFATTLFNAAFHGGYDIVERVPHSYYFHRYPVGHEATLSFPKPDLVIRNDTDAGLLVRCTYTATSITVSLYGDNGGRKVRRKVSTARDLTDPPIEFVADPSIDPDDEEVEEKGQRGWTVDVSRIIEFTDKTKKKEGRKVVYKPRKRVVRVHPCRVPEGDEGYTGEECPEPEEDDADAEEPPADEAAPAAEPEEPSTLDAVEESH